MVRTTFGWPSFLVVLFLLLGVSGTVLAQDSEFPGRAIYADIPVISTEDLRANRDKYVVIDVRSSFEFDTIQVTNSLNLPLDNKEFRDVVKELWTKVSAQGIQGIVFYCNGKTCYKSYKAVQKANQAGVDKAFAYDAGIFDWAQANPDHAALLGKTPVDTSRLISDEAFKAKCLPPQEFAKRVSRNVAVLDIREPHQSGGLSLFTGFQRNISLQDLEKIRRFVQRASLRGKPILAYDNVGKQVRWLQYYFEELGVREYNFMCGGAKNFFKTLGN